MNEKRNVFDKCVRRWHKYDVDNEYDISHIFYRVDENNDPDAILCGVDHATHIEIVAFYPFRKEKRVKGWNFDIDNYIFKILEEGYNILFMSIETHQRIWKDINLMYPEDLKHVQGFKKYISYCKRNHISKELIYNQTFCEVEDIYRLVKKHEKKKLYER